MSVSVPVSIPLALIDTSKLVFHESDILDLHAPNIDNMFDCLFAQTEKYLQLKETYTPHPHDFLLKDELLEDQPKVPRRHQLPWNSQPKDPRPLPAKSNQRIIHLLTSVNYTMGATTPLARQEANKTRRGVSSQRRRNQKKAAEYWRKVCAVRQLV